MRFYTFKVSTKESPLQAKKTALLAKEFIEDKKGEEPIILDVAKLTSIAHYFVITHGNSVPHVKALAGHIMESFKSRKIKLYHSEGIEAGEWVLLDYGSVLIHIFYRDKRSFYNLESLWGDAKTVK